MNDLILNKIKSSIKAPQFKQVIFEELPIGCLAHYEYNNPLWGSLSLDTPLTFGWNTVLQSTPHIIPARDFFGQLPPHADKRVLAHLIVGDEAIQSIVEALLSLEENFCNQRQLIFCYRGSAYNDSYTEYGILIRQPVLRKNTVSTPVEKPKGFLDKLFHKDKHVKPQ